MKTAVIGTPGKVAKTPAYSFTFSFMSQADDGVRMKLLIPAELPEDEAAQVVTKLLEFLQAYHAGELAEDIRQFIAAAPRLGHTLLVSYDMAKGSIVVLDVRSKSAIAPPSADD